MFFILSKIFIFLIQPFTWGILFIVWSLLAKSMKKKKKLLLYSLIILLLFSNKFLFSETARLWERNRDTHVNEKYDAAIVLGGYASLDDNNRVNFHEASGRLFQAIALYKSKKVNKIILSGGSGDVLYKSNKEANYVSSFLIDNNILQDDIIIESLSRNTYENAINTKEILDSLKFQKTILITSAFHMYRAKKCFNKQGAYPDVLTTNYFTKQSRRYNPSTFLIPTSETLFNWNILIKEWVGILSYKLTGKI